MALRCRRNMRKAKEAFGLQPAAILQNTGSKNIRLFILIDPVKCHAKNSLEHMVRFSSIPHGCRGAYDGELGAAHDCAVGLQTQWHGFSDAQITRIAWPFCAHPDLAGKLAAAKRLTKESTSEQASAGLDALTDEERAKFQELNTQYVKKHGFPFIIAVRDHSKAFCMRLSAEFATPPRLNLRKLANKSNDRRAKIE